MKMYTEWCNLCNYQSVHEGVPDTVIKKELQHMSSEELCDMLGKFLLKIHKQSGEYYPWETVYEILMCVQADLVMKGRYCKFLKDIQFIKLQNALK